MTLKIELNPDDTRLVRLIGRALTEYAEEPETGAAKEPASAGSADGYKEPDQPPSNSWTSQVDPSQITHTETKSDAPSADVDEKGVPHNVDFCARAADPFFKSGPRKGQWKKRVGVTQEAYDEWYASQLSRDTADAEPLPDFDKNKVRFEPSMCERVLHCAGDRDGTWIAKSGIPLETFDVWYASVNNGVPPKGLPQSDARQFESFGEFMAAVSELQTAGHVTQSDIDAAYAKTGLKIQDVVKPENAPRLSELYQLLGG